MPVPSHQSAISRPRRRWPLLSRVVLALGVVLTVLWILSRYYIAWVWCDGVNSTTGFGIGYGVVGGRTFPFPSSEHWNSFALDRTPNPHWDLWRWSAQPTGFTDFAVTLWPLALVPLAIGLWTGFTADRGTGEKAKIKTGSRRIAIGIAAVFAGTAAAAVCALCCYWPVSAQWNAWTVRSSSGLVSLVRAPGTVQSLRWRRTDRQTTGPVINWLVPAEIDPIPAQTLSSAPLAAFIAQNPRPGQPSAATFTPDWSIGLAHGLSTGGTWLLWLGARARRRARVGSCFACGYSLAGIGGHAACPECGKAR